MTLLITQFNEDKHIITSEVVNETVYRNCKGYEIVKKTVDELANWGVDNENKDINDEYLIITLEDGNTATFFNSNVALFRIS